MTSWFLLSEGMQHHPMRKGTNFSQQINTFLSGIKQAIIQTYEIEKIVVALQFTEMKNGTFQVNVRSLFENQFQSCLSSRQWQGTWMVWLRFSTTRWPLLGEFPITITVSPLCKKTSFDVPSSGKKHFIRRDSNPGVWCSGPSGHDWIWKKLQL